MKKILLLFSIAVCYLSAQSQPTFNASPTTVTSGSNQQVTLTAVGESNTGTYVTNIGSINPLGPNITATIVSISYFDLATSTPTKVVVIFNNTSNTADAIVPQLTGTYTDVQAGTSTTTTLFVNQAITVKPYPAPPPPPPTSIYARLVGIRRVGEGSVVIADFYSDAACLHPLTLSSALTINVTWYKYVNTTDNTTTGFTMAYTVPQGTSGLTLGHREFFSTNPYLWTPPGILPADQAQSVVLQASPSFTVEPNAGIFTYN